MEERGFLIDRRWINLFFTIWSHTKSHFDYHKWTFNSCLVLV